jgi:DNA-binding LytR/AlgR family response regulator
MKIVIIEDEKITADDLAATIKSMEPEAEIVATPGSVKAAISYFQNNIEPDLIFSDVQLGDGLSFDIFKTIKISAPVIFCTAYDEYALNAFKTNSIDYILKPTTSAAIAEALEKYRNLRLTFSSNNLQYKALFDMLLNKETPKSSAVLVHYKDKIMPVKLDDIALFYLETEITYLITLDRKTYTVNKNLEELEQITGNNFFRANRQCLLNRKTVIDASHYFSRKLSVNISVPFKDKITVSKEKTPQFLNWLENVIG